MKRESNPENRSPASLLAFLIGEWTGDGKVTTKTRIHEFRSRMICLKTPGTGELQILRFGGSGSSSIFFAEHLHILGDRADGSLVSRTELFDYTNFGDTVTEKIESVSLTDSGFLFQTRKGSQSAFSSRAEYFRESDEALRISVNNSEGKVSWSEEYSFRRRNSG